MAAGRSVTDILAEAKGTLNKANALSDTAAKEREAAAPKPAPHVSTAPPKHEYSDAPYSVAKEAHDTGKGIKSAMETRAKAQKALQ